MEQDMGAITHSIMIFSAALGILVFGETNGDAAFNVENHFSSSPYAAIRIPVRTEVRRAPNDAGVLVHKSAHGPDVPDTEVSPRFTCAQMQVIDEVDLSGEEAPSANCD
jgi:hypothetical protein